MRGGLMLGATALLAGMVAGAGAAAAYCTPGDATCERLESLGKDRPRRTTVPATIANLSRYVLTTDAVADAVGYTVTASLRCARPCCS